MRAHVGHPVAQRLVDRVLQRRAAARRPRARVAPSSFMRKTFSDWRCTSSAPMKTSHCRPSSARHRRRRDAVLAGAGLGDDAPLAHAPRQQALAERVVDLVRAGVTEVLALQVDLRAAQALGEARGEVERRLAAGVLAQVVAHLAPEVAVAAQLRVRRLELEQRRHERLGDVAAAELAEVPRAIRQLCALAMNRPHFLRVLASRARARRPTRRRPPPAAPRAPPRPRCPASARRRG